jgi:hypothetical protein
MDREPHFIAPVLVMAVALIVTGGIATGLVESADQARAAVVDQAGTPTVTGASSAPAGDGTPTPAPTGNVTATANATWTPVVAAPGGEVFPSAAPRR